MQQQRLSRSRRSKTDAARAVIGECGCVAVDVVGVEWRARGGVRLIWQEIDGATTNSKRRTKWRWCGLGTVHFDGEMASDRRAIALGEQGTLSELAPQIRPSHCALSSLLNTCACVRTFRPRRENVGQLRPMRNEPNLRPTHNSDELRPTPRTTEEPRPTPSALARELKLESSVLIFVCE